MIDHFLRAVCPRSPRRSLEATKVLKDFRTGPVLRADEFAPDNAMLVDDIGFRPLVRAVEVGGAVLRVVDAEQADFVLDQVVLVGLPVLVHADGQHLHLGQLLLHGGERGQFSDTRQTRGSPEVKNHNLPAIIGQMDAARSVRYCEVRGHAAGLPGMATAIAAGCK